MSEYKKPRAVTEIQQEFNQLAFQSGQLQYQIFALSKDLDLMNDRLRDLNFEAKAAQDQAAAEAKEKADAEAKAKAAETPPAPPALAVVPSEAKGS